MTESIHMMFFLCVAGVHGESVAEPNIDWFCSADESHLQTMPVVKGATADSIRLEIASGFQAIDGFGGGLNQLGWEELGATPVRLDVPAQSMNTIRVR